MIKVKVNPNSKSFEIKGQNKWLNVIESKVRTPANNDKANQELEKELSKTFDAKTKIIQGRKSRLKTILVKAKKMFSAK